MLPKPTPVKVLADSKGIRVFQPHKISEIIAELSALRADLAVIVAYGKILPPEALAATQKGNLNVHFSCLPKYRGAAPIAWSLMRGEQTTGVTCFWLDAGMDTGPIQRLAEISIAPEDDAVSLTQKLSELGLWTLSVCLSDIEAGRIFREAQRGEPSLAPKLKPEDRVIAWDMPAEAILNRVRALAAGPPASLRLQGGPINVFRARLGDMKPAHSARPGAVVDIEAGKGFLVQCQTGKLWILEVQPGGKKRMPAAAFLNGLHLKKGDTLR